MKILILEPFLGGSHKQWAEGLKAYSKHEVEILGLPARRWKWRMHGGAISLAEKYLEKYKDSKPDLILVSDMLDLTTFQSLTKKETADIPTAIYFHENQMSYPISPKDSDVTTGRDLHYGFINIVSALAADYVFFNSNFHKTTFISESQKLLSKFSKEEAKNYLDNIAKKSSVLHVGIDNASLEAKDLTSPEKLSIKNKPAILWNHRWEFDKNPELFFNTLFEIQNREIDFELIVLGESPKNPPAIFKEAKERLSSKIIHWGFVESREQYAGWLNYADIMPVTSNQEFFGISVCEGILSGCMPLLPNRLSYPELLPEELHSLFIYQDDNELLTKLKAATTQQIPQDVIEKLKKSFKRFTWDTLVKQYDESFERLVF